MKIKLPYAIVAAAPERAMFIIAKTLGKPSPAIEQYPAHLILEEFKGWLSANKEKGLAILRNGINMKAKMDDNCLEERDEDTGVTTPAPVRIDLEKDFYLIQSRHTALYGKSTFEANAVGVVTLLPRTCYVSGKNLSRAECIRLSVDTFGKFFLPGTTWADEAIPVRYEFQHNYFYLTPYSVVADHKLTTTSMRLHKPDDCGLGKLIGALNV